MTRKSTIQMEQSTGKQNDRLQVSQNRKRKFQKAHSSIESNSNSENLLFTFNSSDSVGSGPLQLDSFENT